MKLRLTIIILTLSFFTGNAYSQFFPRFSLAGGPTIGWQFQNVDDLNMQMDAIGVPGFPTDGFLTLGGGGFIELPIKGLDWLRVGGFGTGFTYERSFTDQNNLSKTVYYSFGSGGVSFDYVLPLSKSFDMTFGTVFSTGNLTLQIYQNTANYGNWNVIFGELAAGAPSENVSRKLTSRFYSAQPRIGLGFFITKYMYAKLDGAYLFSVQNDWQVDNGTPVTNAPDGIKPNGFNINFGLNFGLFTK